ncbi:MAG: L,D-transpeptidase family protein [Proteobacteria bacterium]|nr:L,D-transpeptidase family protein [Pseudomonadota bacterium]
MLDVPARMSFGQSIWNDNGVPDGPLWIRVDRAAQVISVFRGPHEIATAVILYGAPEKPTPPGRYPILAKLKQHRSSLYDADMPYTLRLTGDGIAIHASSIREGRATHGCIGVPEDFAKRLFDLAKKGDAVFIV